MAEGSYATHEYDVLVIGAGGAGLRAAIEARAAGARTAVVCRSLLGKAGTVMAEGGMAAVSNEGPDSWQAHFRDTMRGGHLVNDWQMAQIHAQEAPERLLELEGWGALFERTGEGLIRHWPAGGHRQPRLAGRAGRSGLELLRTLQHQVSDCGIDVFMECGIQRLLSERGRIVGAFGFRRDSGELLAFNCRAVVIATGGGSRAWRIASSSAEHTGDGAALALGAGAQLIDMEFAHFHPTGLAWPPAARGIPIDESVRDAGGELRNRDGRRFLFDYVPAYLKAEVAADEDEARAWRDDRRAWRRPPELMPDEIVARAIRAEVGAGRGSPHGGVWLALPTEMRIDFSDPRYASTRRRLRELTDVEFAAQPIEVLPTCQFTIGGIRVDPQTAGGTVAGLYAAGEAAAGLHGASPLAGNALSELLVFGRRAGLHAARHALSLQAGAGGNTDRFDACAQEVLAPLANRGQDNPYDLRAELQSCMQEQVGLVRSKAGLGRALAEIRALKRRAQRVRVAGPRSYNPAWHLALELPLLLAFAEATTRSALERTESRGAHARDDFPEPDARLADVRVAVHRAGRGMAAVQVLNPALPAALKRLLVPEELQQLIEEQTQWLASRSTSASGAETKAVGSSRPTK